MYSQCPECQTRFRVTAAALRAAHGTVRCGQCGIAFDALPQLSDTLAELTNPIPPSSEPVALADAPGPLAPTDDGTAVAEFHFSADDIEQVFVDARDWQRRFGTTGSAAPVADDELAADLAAAGDVDPAIRNEPTTAQPDAAPSSADVFVHEPEDVEDITLEGERIVIEGNPDEEESAGEFLPGDDAERLPPPPGAEVEPDLDSTDRFQVLRIPVAEPVDRLEPLVPPEPAGPEAATPALARVADHGDVEEELGDGGRSRAQELVWGLGALLLAVVLAAQLTHHYRQELARDPFFGPPVRAIYARLGLPLASNWNPGAYELRQWGASDSAPTPDGRLTIRASLRNRAGFAQPLPLLRLELEDRYGATVARRDFEPREYLKDPAQATRLLAAGAATEAEIAIVDASSDAVGYRLDVCLRDETTAVHCATSAPAKASP